MHDDPLTSVCADAGIAASAVTATADRVMKVLRMQCSFFLVRPQMRRGGQTPAAKHGLRTFRDSERSGFSSPDP